MGALIHNMVTGQLLTSSDNLYGDTLAALSYLRDAGKNVSMKFILTTMIVIQYFMMQLLRHDHYYYYHYHNHQC
jgi:hypothetical protein